MNRLYLFLLGLLLLPAGLRAQTTLIGTISSADEGNLPGATVKVENTTRGAVTNIDGQFSLPLQEGDSVVVVSYIGYTTKRVPLAGQTSIMVVLNVEAAMQEEVVVIGYGTQKKSDLTGSVSSVRGEDLVKVPNNNPLQALQGKATGVQVVSNSGAPGQAPKVRIRGVGSFGDDNKNGPLYVVDGVFMSDISAINSQDIVSLEILKDASAAAIYGVQGANGVILVTTKQGTEGKTRFNFSAEYGVQTVRKKIDVLSGKDFGQVQNELSPKRPPYNNLDALPNTNWQDLVFRASSPVQNYQFSASGGSKNSTFYLGLGYFRQDGIVPNSYYERISIRTNATYNLTDWLKIGTNLTIAPNQQRVVSGNVILNAYRAQPLLAPYRNGGDSISNYNPVPDIGNPLADLEYSSNNYNTAVNGVANAFAEVSLPKGFKYRFNIGIDLNYLHGDNFVPKYFVNTQQQNPQSFLTSNREWRANSLNDNLLYYNRAFGKLAVDALAGLSFYRNYNNSLSSTVYNLLRDTPNIWYAASGQVRAGAGTGTGDLVLKTSYFTRANLTWDGKYTLTGTYRVDASSVFGSANRSAGFPSIAAGWVISQEKFLEDVKAIDFLKLRVSYGKLGNQAVSSTSRFSLINQQAPVVLGQNPVLQPGATLAATSNPGLRWETTNQADAGLEIGVLKNRLTVEVDYYNRFTRDILVDLSAPGYYGNGDGQRITYNAASVTNSGFEFNVSWRDKIGKVGYRVGALGTTVNNKVMSLGATLANDQYIVNGAVANYNVTRTEVGRAIGSFYGYDVQGVYQTDDELANSPHLSGARVGDFKYRDVNGDNVLDEKDRTFIGSPVPKFVYGFNGGVNFFGFDLSADFQGQFGNKIYNGKKEQRTNGNPNYEGDFRNHWTAANPSTSIPRPEVNTELNFQPSSYFVEDGSYLRLRTLTLSYALPDNAAKYLRFQNANVYLRGTNLVTWTKYTGYTPEIGGTNDLSAGIDNGVYPVTTVYSLGANATF